MLSYPKQSIYRSRFKMCILPKPIFNYVMSVLASVISYAHWGMEIIFEEVRLPSTVTGLLPFTTEGTWIMWIFLLCLHYYIILYIILYLKKNAFPELSDLDMHINCHFNTYPGMGIWANATNRSRKVLLIRGK